MRPLAPVPAWRVTVSMFTVIPAGGPQQVDSEQARRIVLWLPVLGVGSRRQRQEALDIMRRSDVGPLGVAALLLVVLVQVTSLATLPAGWPGAMALCTAVVTSRVAVVLAAGSPAARQQGFGALVAGATTRRARVLVTTALLAIVAAAGVAGGGLILAARGLSGVIAGLAAAAWLSRVARRRLGGMTGDVFGALIELSCATALLAFALFS